MLQRIQTIFLLLAVIALALMAVFNIASYQAEEDGNKAIFEVKLSGVTFSAFKDENALPTFDYGEYIDEQIEKKGLSKVFTIGTILLVAGIAILVLIILQFKRLKLQKNLGRLMASLLFMTGGGLIVAGSLGERVITRSLSAFSDTIPGFSTSYGIATFLPFVAGILILIANIYINKDINLLKSTERLR